MTKERTVWGPYGHRAWHLYPIGVIRNAKSVQISGVWSGIRIRAVIYVCDFYWKPQNFLRKVTLGGFRQCTSEQQRLLGNCDKAKCFILVPELEQMTISSFKEMRVKREPIQSLEEKPTMQPQNKYTYLHIQTLYVPTNIPSLNREEYHICYSSHQPE